MAKEIGQQSDTVRKWWMKRIPTEHWPAVIEAASRQERTLTAEDLMRLNPPRKVRDPASWRRKVKKLRARAKPRKQGTCEATTS
jgi:hypothetical protein